MPLVDFVHSFRSEFSYSNTLYHFMGLLVTRASGQPWQTFIQNEVWQPLGMHSTYVSQQQIPADKARMHGHYWNGKKTQYSAKVDDYNLQLATPTGSFWTTLHDTKRYLQFLLNGGKTYNDKQLVKPELLNELFKPQVVINQPIYAESAMVNSNWRTYGLGWFQQDIDGMKVDYHTGSQYGLSTMLGLDLKRGVAYAMFNNRDHTEMRHAMLWHLMDAADGSLQKDWNKTIHDHYVNREKEHFAHMQKMLENRVAKTKPSLPLADYAGTYRDEYGAEITVEVEDSTSLRITDGIYSDKLKHWHFDSFYTTGSLTLEPTYLVLTFDTDYTGKVGKVSMGQAVYYRVPEDNQS
ncbi:MAG: serine hydrolase [Gammaproteobacteria bacterium]|nr:serine hydrolase [Gammaproteobacteria bacterium]